MNIYKGPTTGPSLGWLLGAMHSHQRLFAAAAVICAVLGGTWQAVVGKQYKATALVALAPVGSEGGGGIGSLIGGLGPLAVLAGVAGLGGQQRLEPIAVLQSRLLTERYIRDNNLLPTLFWRRWDDHLHGWRESFLHRRFPTLWDGSEKFADVRRVVQDSKTSLVTVTITWRDPQTAAKWANDLVALTNSQMREKEFREAQRNVAYLTDQVTKTNVVEVRNALSALIENQIKREMLANGTEEFALKVIDPAIPPEKPSSPGIALATLFGALGGLLAAVFIVYVQASLTAAREPGRGDIS